MMSSRPVPVSRRLVFLALSLLFPIAGCLGSQSAEMALKKSMDERGFTKSPVYPFAGKVTVDGLPVESNQTEKVVVMLVDATKLDSAPHSGAYVMVGKGGEFSFHTYKEGDGVKEGTYIVSIAKLNAKKRDLLVGPDGFQNLYNDATRNQTEHPEFKINHHSPGKKDYVFELKVAGREPAEANSKALTRLVR
jgi:hypothetical protein